MAIPFILGGLAIAGAAYGIKKGVDAYNDNEEANSTSDSANYKYKKSLSSLEAIQHKSNDMFDSLGKLQMDIIETTFKKQYEKLIDKLEIDWESDKLDPILKDYGVDNLHKVCNDIVTLSNATLGLSGGAIAGAVAGFGAYGAVGLLGAASTGTAISALSGAAATNATLAWFGGGSLAAGGFGMAGGMVVLSSIVAGPIIATFGKFVSMKAEEKLNNAKAYRSAISLICEGMKSEELMWKTVFVNAKEKRSDLENMNSELKSVIKVVNKIADDVGVCVSEWSKDAQVKLTEMMQLAQTMVEVIEAPIMNDDNVETKEIIRLQKETAERMKKVKQEFDV